MGLQSVKNLLNNSILRESRFPAWQPACPQKPRTSADAITTCIASSITTPRRLTASLPTSTSAPSPIRASTCMSSAVTDIANASPPRTSTSCASPRTTSPSANHWNLHPGAVATGAGIAQHVHSEGELSAAHPAPGRGIQSRNQNRSRRQKPRRIPARTGQSPAWAHRQLLLQRRRPRLLLCRRTGRTNPARQIARHHQRRLPDSKITTQRDAL